MRTSHTVLATLLSAGISLAALPVAPAQDVGTLTTIYFFQANGSQGEYANGLVQGTDGSFYGTTVTSNIMPQSGPILDYGTIFKFTPSGTFTLLHTFSDGTDGETPTAPLILGTDGNLYGTTSGFRPAQPDTPPELVSEGGTVFKITPDGTLTTLHSFSQADGTDPAAALVEGKDGNFYGTTHDDGAGLYGTVFKITPAGVVTTLHNFLNAGGGAHPAAPLVEGLDGNLYGTTEGNSDSSNGQTITYGTVFEISPAGDFNLVYAFANGADGASPATGLTLGNDGNLYGTTPSAAGQYVGGTVFKVTPGGILTTLHTFTGGSDGVNANRLLLGKDGNFYGTTQYDDIHYNGTVFEITPTGNFTTLYHFTDNNDGRYPIAGLIDGNDGNFYGTTSGGLHETIFKLAVGPLPFFTGEVALADNVFYLSFANDNDFGYYEFLNDGHYIYHFDLGFEYIFDAADGHDGVYLYDFTSDTFFYTSPTFPFPYLYDFSLNTVLYYYPDPNNPGHYNTNGIRYFYNFNTGMIISK